MDENRKYEDFTEKIELAVKEGRDDLAEAAIARQLDIEVQIPILETTISDCRAQETELEGYLAALQAKKREMKDELRQFRRRNQEAAGARVADGDPGPDGNPSVEGKVARAESAFERVYEKATGLPRSSQAGDRHSAAQLAELEEMTRKNKIQERLAAIKKDVNPS
jgi:phage shock protein A